MADQKVSLGGKEWIIPELAIRQIRQFLPALRDVAPVMEKMEKAEPITEAEIDKIYGLAFIALGRHYPDLTREEFDDHPIKLDEVVSALPVLIAQAGLVKTEQKLGEKKAARKSISTSS